MNTVIEKQKKKFETRRGRLITVNDVRWKWFMARSYGTITAHSENGESTSINSYELNVGNEITPADIANWLKAR